MPSFAQPQGSPPPGNPAGYLILATLLGDFGAAASVTISQLAVVPDHAYSPQPSSSNVENGRCVTGVIPGGSTDPVGGGLLVVSATVMGALPLLPSLVAVICEDPAANAVTSPDAETLATPGLLDVQVTERPVRILLFASRVTADPCVVAPILRELSPSETATEATGVGELDTESAATLSVALPRFVPRVAMIDADPGERPVTNPLLETSATAGLLELQVTVEESWWFHRSRTVA
jgi:hypothetical protein